MQTLYRKLTLVNQNKKILCCVVLATIMAIVLVGCSASAAQQSHIRPAGLTGDQRDLIDFITAHNSEILLFEFVALESFEAIEFWLETYEYGISVERVQGIHQVNAEAHEGQLAVIIHNENGLRDFQWTFIVGQDGTRGSNRVKTSTIDHDGFARGFGAITEPVYIQDGQEIILYMSKFSSSGLRTFSDMQVFVEQPELLAQYPYVHIIKARFSR